MYIYCITVVFLHNIKKSFNQIVPLSYLSLCIINGYVYIEKSKNVIPQLFFTYKTSNTGVSQTLRTSKLNAILK